MEKFEIRKWACVNSRIAPASMQSTIETESADPLEKSPDIGLASKHRSAILESATRIIDLRGQTLKKRKAASHQLQTRDRKKKVTPAVSKLQSSTRSSNRNAVNQRLPLKEKNSNIKSYLATAKQDAHPQSSLSKLVDDFIEAKDTSVQHSPQSSLPNSIEQTLRSSDVDTADTSSGSSVQVPTRYTNSAFVSCSHTGTASKELTYDITLPLSTLPVCFTSPKIGDVSTITGSSAPACSQSSSSTASSGMRPFLRKIVHEIVSLDGQNSLPRILPALRIITCFRVAEVLRHIKDLDIMVELFAIATPIDDSKPSGSQTYKLADLFFPNRPPYLTGSHTSISQRRKCVSSVTTKLDPSSTVTTERISGTLIVSSPTISKANSEQLVRAMIRPLDPVTSKSSFSKTGPSGNNSDTKLDRSGVIAFVHIEAIWESDWEEIEYVRGIVDPDGSAAEHKNRAC